MRGTHAPDRLSAVAETWGIRSFERVRSRGFDALNSSAASWNMLQKHSVRLIQSDDARAPPPLYGLARLADTPVAILRIAVPACTCRQFGGENA